MTEYKLIGLDKMEATKLRRRLDPWTSSKSEPVKPLIKDLFAQCGCTLKIDEPRWEANVYPLYYYYPESLQGKEHAVYERVFVDYERLFAEVDQPLKAIMREYIVRITNAEIDLLIEDKDYYIFVEAKDPRPDQKVRFAGGTIHQLVCQFVQGKILEKLIDKRFMMATLGVGLLDLSALNDTNKSLMAAVGNSDGKIELCDFKWTILG
jgi:hypothetical protein